MIFFRLSFFILSLGFCSGSIGQILTTFTVADGLINDNVYSISKGANASLWFGTHGGVSFYDGSEFSDSITVADGLVHESVFAVLETTDGNVWMGTDFGLSRYDGSACVTYTTDDGLEDNRVKHLYEDSEGQLWIAHNDGVSSFDGELFTNYTMSDGLPFGGVTHSVEDNNGDMWFATGLGGAFHFDGTTLTGYGLNEGIPNLSVRSIAVDADNRKWIGTNEGIVVFDDNNEVEMEHPSLIELPAPHEINPVEDIKIDLEGRVWTGIYVDYLVTVGGVAYHNGAEWIDYSADDGLAGPNVSQLAVDQQGDVWAATSTGVTRFSGTPLDVVEEPQEALLVFPNPAVDEVNIRWPNDVELNSARVLLMDGLGKVVLNQKATGQHERIRLTGFQSGSYIIRIESNEYSASRQVVIFSAGD